MTETLITPEELSVLKALVTYCKKHGRVPVLRTLAVFTHYSHEQTRTHLRALADKGLVDAVKTMVKGRFAFRYVPNVQGMLVAKDCEVAG